MLRPAVSRNVPAGVYEVTKQLPHSGLEFEYRIKSHQGSKPSAVGRARAWYEHADERLFRSRARRERPHDGCDAEERNELASPQTT